jgi:DNA-binding transcriptional regulator YhcF (GntR family)
VEQFQPIRSFSSATHATERRPKYLLAAEQIRDRILRGTLRPGDRLPSERDLAASFHVAYLTVRQALHQLSEEGFVERHHGRGTFVADRRSQPRMATESAPPPIFLLGLGPQMDARRDPVNWEVHLFRYQGIVEGGFQFGLPIEVVGEWNGHLDDTILKKLKTGTGVILGGDQVSDADIERLLERKIRVVVINRHRGLLCSEVQVDTKQGAILAVEHLLQLGHRRIGIIVGDQRKPLMKLRLEGYKEALGHYGVAFDERLMVTDVRGSAEDGAAATEKLLRMKSPPTAIFAGSDQRAIGALARAREMGRKVPERVSIVGFDDLQEAAQLDPPLTTVHNPLHQSGYDAVRLINDHYRDPDLGVQLVRLPMSLVVRQSTARLYAGGRK